MPFVLCRDCEKPAEVAKLARGKGYFTRNHPEGCQCGTDQRRGKIRQDWIQANMVDSVDQLTIILPIPSQIPPKKSELEPVEEEKPPAGRKPYSKLWLLTIPVIGLGLVFAKMAGNKK